VVDVTYIFCWGKCSLSHQRSIKKPGFSQKPGFWGDGRSLFPNSPFHQRKKKMNLPGFNDEEIRQQIASIASNFKLFQCKDCALAIMEFLITRNISGKHVKLYTGRSAGKYGNIYHDRLGSNISTNGRHEGVAVEIGGEEIIFDNIDCKGVSRQEWLDNFYCVAMDLGGGFEITEINF
jgi:hypothetical protein